MTNEWQIIFLNNMKHEIITIDLRSGLMKTFKHILVSQWFTSWLDVFRETKYFCVCELGRR